MRTVMLMTCVCAVLLGAASCKKGNESSNGKPGSETKKEVKTNVDGLVQHFRNSGLTVSETTPKLAEMIGAAEGLGVKIGDTTVEVYRFDMTKKDPMKKAKGTFVPSFYVTGIKGAYLVAIPKESKIAQKIIAAFNSYSGKAEVK